MGGFGYTPRLASAPTPLAALSLARCSGEQHVDAPHRLADALGALPVSVLDWEQSLIDRLDGVGVRRLGDLLRLPREGVARRFGPHRLDRKSVVSGKGVSVRVNPGGGRTLKK